VLVAPVQFIGVTNSTFLNKDGTLILQSGPCCYYNMLINDCCLDAGTVGEIEQ